MIIFNFVVSAWVRFSNKLEVFIEHKNHFYVAVNTFPIKAWCYRLNVCAPSIKNVYVEILTPKWRY